MKNLNKSKFTTFAVPIAMGLTACGGGGGGSPSNPENPGSQNMTQAEAAQALKEYDSRFEAGGSFNGVDLLGSGIDNFENKIGVVYSNSNPFEDHNSNPQGPSGSPNCVFNVPISPKLDVGNIQPFSCLPLEVLSDTSSKSVFLRAVNPVAQEIQCNYDAGVFDCITTGPGIAIEGGVNSVECKDSLGLTVSLQQLDKDGRTRYFGLEEEDVSGYITNKTFKECVAYPYESHSQGKKIGNPLESVIELTLLDVGSPDIALSDLEFTQFYGTKAADWGEVCATASVGDLDYSEISDSLSYELSSNDGSLKSSNYIVDDQGKACFSLKDFGDLEVRLSASYASSQGMTSVSSGTFEVYKNTTGEYLSGLDDIYCSSGATIAFDEAIFSEDPEGHDITKTYLTNTAEVVPYKYVHDGITYDVFDCPATSTTFSYKVQLKDEFGAVSESPEFNVTSR